MKRITALILALCIAVLPAFAEGEQTVQLLDMKNITNGLPALTDGLVTRGGFAMCIDRVMNLNFEGESRFADVHADTLYGKAVANLSKAKIISGSSGNLFLPDAPVTMLEAAVIAVRAYEYMRSEASVHPIADVGEVEFWAQLSVETALGLGIIKKTDLTSLDSGITAAKSEDMILCLMLALNKDSENNGYVSAEIEQTVRGNIFTAGNQKQIIVSSSCSLVEIVINDYWDAEAARFTQSVDGSAVIDIPIDRPGYYELYIYANDHRNIRTQVAKTTFAVLAPFDFNKYSVDQSSFGISTHLNFAARGWEKDLVDEIAQMGAKIIRDDLEWNNLEQQKGVYSVDIAKQISMIEERNMGFLIAGGYNNPLYDHNMTPYTDAGRDGYANYMINAIKAVGPSLVAVDDYNEFWGPSFGSRNNSPAQSKPEYYIPLVKRLHEAMKREFPDILLLANYCRNEEHYTGWYEETLKLGIADYMDGIYLHPYFYTRRNPETVITEWMDHIAQMHKTYNVSGKELWVTETGMQTTGAPERMQAQYIPRAYAIYKSRGIEKVIWYNFMNDGITPEIAEYNFGLIRNKKDPLGAFVPKSSYVAYAAMTRELTNAEYTSGSISEDGIYHYTFEEETGETVNLLWSTAENKNIAIKTGAPLNVTDVMGGKDVLTPVDGTVYLTLSQDVLYIKGDLAEISTDLPFAISLENTTTNRPVQARMTFEGLGTEDIAFESEGRTHRLSVNEGVAATSLKSVSGNTEKIARFNLLLDGQKCGMLSYIVTVVDPYSIEVKPAFEDLKEKQGAVSIDFSNNTQDVAELMYIDWIFAEKTGRFEANAAIEPFSVQTLDIPVGDVDFGAIYNTNMKFCIDAVENRYAAEVRMEFNPISKQTIKVDGVLDDSLNELPVINLADGKWVDMITGSYKGEQDLSGQMWLTWDDDNLYLSAKITDDNHFAAATGANIWQNDSLQFAFCAKDVEGFGETSFYELGAGLTSSGSQVWRWQTASSRPTGAVENAQCGIIRNEADKTTTYEMAFPWNELMPLDPTKHEYCDFSLLVNDNDDGERKGWLEWGSGIGSNKNPALYRTFIFLGEEESK